jgi:glycine dehydrogenase subunit 1
MSFVANTESDRRKMMETLGISSLEELLAPIPATLRAGGPPQVGPRLTEAEVLEHLSDLAARNRPASSLPSFLGGGVTRHLIPSVVRHLALRSEFYTAYTPYQAEASQGTLQVIFEFQTLIARLTGMEVANASLYDGASALAEAMLMAYDIRKRTRRRFLVSRGVNPRYREAVRSYARGRRIAVDEIPLDGEGTTDRRRLEEALGEDVAGVIFAQPNYLGLLERAPALAEAARSVGALAVVSVDPISLSLVRPPGSYGADIVTGEGQCFGNSVSFGGPLLGLLATRRKHMRQLPGRLVSLTADAEGNRGYVLTLQTREQHIRREKATSNICTNQSLMALCAAIHLAAIGEEGFQELGRSCLASSHELAERLERAGLPRIHSGPFFREFAVRSGRPARDVLGELRELGINGGIPLGRDYPELEEGAFLVSVTEANRPRELEAYETAARKLKGGKGA